MTEVIRYYAKVDANKKIFYFSESVFGSWGHIGSAEALGDILSKTDFRKDPSAQLMNGPAQGWTEKAHSDCMGEYQLRELNHSEEEKLLRALRGK